MEAAPALGAPAETGQAYPVKWPMGRVIVFSIISLGVYSFYWFYVTRKQVTQQIGGNDNAGLQTLGQIVPILNWVIIYWLWRDISALRERVGLTPLNVTLYIVLLVVGSVFVGPLVLVIYILVLNALNEYWEMSTNGQAVNKPITTGELLATFVPLVVFVLIIVLVIASS